jgi:electron transport complex protein RnfG
VLIDFLKQSWLVIVAALVFGLLVSGIYGQLDPIIKKNEREKLEREMKGLLVSATTFEMVADETDPQGEKALYYVGKSEQGEVAGYAIIAEGGGFADKILLLVGLDGQLEKLLGIAILKTNETPGFGDKIKDGEFKDQFQDCPATKLMVAKTGDRSVVDDKIVAITGATISSEAVATIVNGAVNSLRELLGIEAPAPEPGMRGMRRGIRCGMSR